VKSLLLELAPDGAIVKLELATQAGLLTLHPDPGGTRLHGNVVRASGVEHVTLSWSDAHALVVGASAVTGAVAAARLAASVAVGEGRSFPAVEVGEDLALRRATWRAARVGERRWRLQAADGGPSVVVTLDPDGIPVALDDEETWPLEIADHA
jgi:hypothetical protein